MSLQFSLTASQHVLQIVEISLRQAAVSFRVAGEDEELEALGGLFQDGEDSSEAPEVAQLEAHPGNPLRPGFMKHEEVSVQGGHTAHSGSQGKETLTKSAIGCDTFPYP